MKILPVGAALRLLRAIRSLRSPKPEPEPAEEPFSLPFTAEEDFEPGDKLIFIGDSLYKWKDSYHIPHAFIACRSIKAGELVFNDPTRPERSDVRVSWTL